MLARGESWRAEIVKMAWLAAGASLLLVPWMARTSLQFDAPVLLTTRTGTALLVGHGPGASGGPDLDSYYALAERFRDVREPQRAVEIDRAAFRAAREEVLDDPVGDLRLVPKKLAWLYGHDPAWSIGRIAFIRLSVRPLSYDVIRSLADVYYYVVIAGVLLTLLPGRPAASHNGYLILVGLIVLWSFMFGFLFFGDDRYHMPLLPAFCLLAAAGYATLLSHLSDLRAQGSVAGHDSAAEESQPTARITPLASLGLGNGPARVLGSPCERTTIWFDSEHRSSPWPSF
jgi:hypothetical protein